MDNHFNSQQIKDLRKALNISQSELARTLKVDVRTIMRWEKGENRPSSLARRQLSRLAKRNGQ